MTAGYYYDSAAGTVTKAVAKTSAKSYNSLASAIADVASGTTISLLRASSEAITLDKAITLTETAAYSGTLSGSGTLTLTALRNTAMTFGTWTGVVVLPADQSFGGTFFDDYGIAGSTVRLQGTNTGWLHYGTVNATTDRGPIATTIEIPENASLTITSFSPSWANTFNVIKDAGTFAVNLAAEPDHSSSEVSAYFLLKDVSDFTGSLSVTGAGIAIGASKPAYTTTGGKIILTTSATIATGKTWTATDGIVLADAAATLTNVDGVLSPAPTTSVAGKMVVDETNLETSAVTYSVVDIVATYGGENYATFEAAIAAALAAEGGEANLASITVVDATAELPAGYLIVDNYVVKAQGAIVDTEGTAHYYATPTAAAADIDSYLGMVNQKTYSYFAVYFGTDVEMSVNLGAMAWNVFHVKVKCLNDATVSVVPNSVEYEFSAGEPDENSIVTYTKSEKATTYVWVGTGESPTSWGNYHKWKIGTSEGAAAVRAPSTLDTVIINGGAPISISGVTVAAMQIGGDAKISGSGTLTATTGGIVLTDAAATLTVTGVTLSPVPTTNVSRHSVVPSTSDGTTTYRVEAIPGTIFSVY